MRSTRRRLGLLCTVAASVVVAGCTSLTLAIANIPATFGDYSVERNIQYAAGVARRLDVYTPTAAGGARPVVVFFHGGGWDSGSKAQYRFVAEALSTRGYVVVLPEYRRYPQVRFPGFVEDAAQAVAWTRTHAAEFGGDPARLFLMGHSAGAHIAAMLNFDERFLRAAGVDPHSIKGFIGLAGPYDFLPLNTRTLEAIFAPTERYADSQPINFVDGGESPSLVLHGLADSTVWPRNSQRLAAKIRERGGRVAEHYYEGVSHGGILAGLSVYYRDRRTVLEEIGKFVDSP